MKTVLFACVHNAGRSQMAAAIFNAAADPAKAVLEDSSTRLVDSAEHRLRLLDRRRLHHHPHQRLRAAGADQHPTVVAELGFDAGDEVGEGLGGVADAPLDAHVAQHLWEARHRRIGESSQDADFDGDDDILVLGVDRHDHWFSPFLCAVLWMNS
jgi:hypothetical protein